jgi:hypothetical protein
MAGKSKIRVKAAQNHPILINLWFIRLWSTGINGQKLISCLSIKDKALGQAFFVKLNYDKVGTDVKCKMAICYYNVIKEAIV